MIHAVLNLESSSTPSTTETEFQTLESAGRQTPRLCADSGSPANVHFHDEDLLRQRRRATRILERQIEFVDSPEFRAPHAIREILGPEQPPHGTAEDGRNGGLVRKAPAGTPPYLASLYEIPLLTPHEEYSLFRKMNFLKYRADRLRRKLDRNRPQPTLMDEIEHSLADALAIRNRIVQANLRLVVAIAKTMIDRDNDFEDIVSEGNLPLIRAVEIFDFERGTRFSTYATWAVRNGLYRSTLRNRRHRQRYRLQNEAAFEAAADDRCSVLALENYDRGLRKSVDDLLHKLDDQRDRVILMARFGLDEQQQPQKFREIAEKLQLSTERVRQLLMRTLDRLRNAAEPDLDTWESG